MLLIRDLIDRCSRYFAGRTAYFDRGRAWTWAEVGARSESLAAGLQRLGVRKGDAVGILCHDRMEVPEHWFACAKIGAIRIGINWRYAPREMRHLIEDPDLKVLIVEKDCIPLMGDLLEEVRRKGRILIGLDAGHGLEHDYDTLVSDPNAAAERPPLADDDLIAVSYTSGTTGLPKGALYTQRSVREAMVHTMREFGLRHEDVFVTPFVIGGLGFVITSFNVINGMTVVIPPRVFDPRWFLEAVAQYRVTSTILIPTLIQRVLAEREKDPAIDLSSLRVVIYGSEPTRPKVIRAAHEMLGCELLQTYGLTEATGGWLTFLRHEDHLRAFRGEPQLLLSCGKPGLHVEISIRDDQGKELPAGRDGEIWVKGATNIRGYLNRPEDEREIFSGPWLRTHDIGRFDAEGYLYLTDRKNFLIITGAYNVYPLAVETVLSEHPAVREVAVFGAPHPEWGEAVVGVVSLRPETEATAEALIAFCASRLARFEVPKYIEIVPDLPKGSTGKIAKNSLREEFRRDPARLPWGGRD